jgi:hypothetical protein
LSPRDAKSAPPNMRLLDFRSGGWVLLLAGVACLAIVGWWLVGVLGPGHRRMFGNGHDVASYGYDLSTCLVPRELLVASGLPKDGLPALTEPEVFTPAQLDEFAHELRRSHQGRFLVDSDRVIGVVIDGQARAYPLLILNWHEVVNDTLGGRPIAITYSPLCDGAVAFDRRAGDETLEFGMSGLVYNSNLVLYDRQTPPAAESLWSQLEFRAIAGPAAAHGQHLPLLPAVLVHWSDWRARYPDTTVLAPERARLKLYQETYNAYFASDKLLFPVTPRPPAGAPLKAPLVIVNVGPGWHTYDITELIGHSADRDTWCTQQDGVELRFELRTNPPAAWPRTAAGEPVQAVYAFRFAWLATHASRAAGE